MGGREVEIVHYADDAMIISENEDDV